MYTYRRKHKPDAGSIFFIILFILAALGLYYLAYIDRGKFWDIFPLVCIPVIIISIILIIINFIRLTKCRMFFILFFLLSVTGLILSNFFGPNALNYKAGINYENKNYEQSISYYRILLDKYPNSWHADEALKNIPYAYLLNNDYSEAIDYFNRAINKEILDNDKLEIKNAIEECYTKLALEYSNDGKYELSAENYLNAVITLEEIKNNFPDTNEAFISIYKIPEYLYKAALNFNKVKKCDKSIECLEKITTDYRESEYFYDASILLSKIYINKATELAKDNSYQESIEEFLKILDLEALDYDYNSINDYYKNSVFSNIPPDLIKNTAQEKYDSGNYRKTIFLCELIIDYAPEMKEDTDYFLINSKLKLISSSEHKPLEQTAPERKFWGPGRSILIIENNTEFDLSVYLKGHEYKIIRITKNSAAEIEITAGDYESAVELNDTDILPYYGKVTYEEGQKYREEYTININEDSADFS